eukprot:scaffold4392_cov34-Attheya_sp.AAC.1
MKRRGFEPQEPAECSDGRNVLLYISHDWRYSWELCRGPIRLQDRLLSSCGVREWRVLARVL